MNLLLRRIGAVLVGLLVAVVIVSVGDAVATTLYPLPAGIDKSNLDQLKAAIASLPAGAFAVIVIGWGLAGLVGAWVTGRLAGRSPGAGLVTGALFLAATVANLLALPHPTWVWAAGIALVLAGVVAGSRLAR